MRTLDNTIIPYQRREYKTLRRNQNVEGIDTETEQGYAKVIADSNRYCLPDDINDVLDFLTLSHRRNVVNCFWNLSFDVECMLKWEPSILKQLAVGNKAWYGKYKIGYIKGKCLTIRDASSHTFKFYDIAQFYHSSLANACKKYLCEEPHEFKTSRATLFKDHQIKDIAEYCKRDADQTKRLAELFIRSLDVTQLKLKHYYSCGYISQQYVLRNCQIPRFNDVPRIVQEAYWRSYRGGWFDTYKRGTFKITAYDINSAYPKSLSEVPDIRDGKWFRGLRNDAIMGVVKVRLTSNVQQGQPLAINLAGKNIYPLYDEPTTMWITLGEYQAFNDVDDMELLDAFSFVPNSTLRYPYRNVIKTLFDKKNSAEKGSMQKLIYKLILNSMYGKTAEVIKRDGKNVAGKLFNPVYASETTARTRLAMWNAINPYRENVVSILTDGVMFDKPVKIPVSSEMGQFDIKSNDKLCVVVQTGVYQFEGETPATRGFKASNDLFKILDTNEQLITTKSLRPLHYKECLKQKDFERIGTFVEIEKLVNVNNDFKRLWNHKIECAKELLQNRFESLPVPVSLLPPLA